MGPHARDEQARRCHEIRERLLTVAAEAYALAGMQGLCREGREELACAAVRACGLDGLLGGDGASLPAREVAALREACVRTVMSGALEDPRP